MAFMCSLCGGILVSEPAKDFPVCSHTGCISIGGHINILDSFADAINILKNKGYKIIGYRIPRFDGWETDYIGTIVFSPHTVPNIVPRGFQVMELVEVCGVMFYCCVVSLFL